MGYRGGLHVLSPEEPSGSRGHTLLVVLGMGAAVIAGTLLAVAIQLAKDAGDRLVEELVETWTGERN